MNEERDYLTGLYRLSAVGTRINHFIRNQMRSEKTGFLLLFDLDDFLDINQQEGYIFGDQILLDVAKQLRISIGETAYLARVGGDSFLVYLCSTTPMETIDLCQNLRMEYRGKYGVHLLTTSIGVSVFPKDGMDFETLYANAQKALGRAKASGKNKTVFYESQ